MKPNFVLMGFDQEAEVRLYAFKRAVDNTGANFTVGVNLALLPSYGITIQELPLLCRELLERQPDGEGTRAVMFTETEMRVHAESRAAARQNAPRGRRSARRRENDGSSVRESNWNMR